MGNIMLTLDKVEVLVRNRHILGHISNHLRRMVELEYRNNLIGTRCMCGSHVVGHSIWIVVSSGMTHIGKIDQLHRVGWIHVRIDWTAGVVDALAK